MSILVSIPCKCMQWHVFSLCECVQHGKYIFALSLYFFTSSTEHSDIKRIVIRATLVAAIKKKDIPFLKLETKFKASDVLFKIPTTLKQAAVILIKLDAQSCLC